MGSISNFIEGSDGNDIINGTDKDDVLNGDAGNDTISDGSGNDMLTGGGGDDTISGSYGSDTYVFNLGDGTDIVTDYDNTGSGSDKLQFGAGIDANAIQLSRSLDGYDLTLSVSATDKVTLTNHFAYPNYCIETIAFADGTSWDYATTLGKLVYNGSAGADSLSGVSGCVNRINGLDGNDTISGADKDDVLIGGGGNDTISGSYGSDTYVFNLGDGSDMISETGGASTTIDVLQLGSGLEVAATQINREGNDLVLAFNANDNVRITGYFANSEERGRVEQIAFADGTMWDYAAVAGKPIYDGTLGSDYLYGLPGVANRINGLGGNDSIYGADKDDMLNGGTGNDMLEGRAGSDTYVYNLGDGSDTISETTGTSTTTDVLQLGAGLEVAATQINREGNDLVLAFNANDKVRITGYFFSSDEKGRIEQIQFADGTVWDYAAVTGKLVYNGTSDSDYLYALWGVANRINGLGGNDSIYGADKDDMLNGGTGNDMLEGRVGSDTYVYNLGDGSDTISETTGTSTTTDVLQLGAGLEVATTQINREGNDLVLAFNANDKVRITGYFFSSDEKGRIEQIQFADGTTWDYAAVAGKLVYTGTESGEYLSGLWDMENRIDGLGGDDTISGGGMDDVLNGDGGNDSLSSSWGSDTLNGGAGNDSLNGSYGSDTYVYNLGDGIDTIDDYDYGANSDKLQFGAGIDANAVTISRSGSDLILGINADDKVMLKNYFSYDSSYRIETIVFADGTTWDYAAVADRLVYTGTENTDFLSGLWDMENRIDGLGGDDTISGDGMDDVLNGGAGDDSLNGGYGSDTYVYNLGDGIDTIDDYDYGANSDKLQFGAGVDANAVTIGRSGSDLILGINADDKVTLKNYFSYDSSYRIETIVFADGTAWDYAAVAGRLVYTGTENADTLYGLGDADNRIDGLGGDDTIDGAGMDDVLTGGAGNDNLSGGAGNDVFRFTSPNEGSDTVSDFTSGTDVIHVVGSNFGLAPGVGVALLAGATTPSASGTASQFLYNTTTGALYFDQDGVESVYGAVQIATLTGQKSLVASDIVVVEV